MRVKTLDIENFRNAENIRIEPGCSLNILVGENAQGKTSILEALWMLATTRSFRSKRDCEMIRRGCDLATVCAEISGDRRDNTHIWLRLHTTERKSVRVNGAARSRAFDLVGQMLAVFFGSGEMEIVVGEPSARRRYLDLTLSQIWPKYCIDLAHYKRVVEQRNRLLKEIRERPRMESGLEAWTEQLVRYGAPLAERRREFLKRLAPKASAYHEMISEGREALDVHYRPDVPIEHATTTSEIEAALRREFERVVSDEIRRGTTLAGPHHDDVSFEIGGAPARAFGSQGQNRTVTLSLKLAELELMEEEAGEPPILLLDDVFSDLDDIRRRKLLEISTGRCQTFLTCTSTRSIGQDLLSTATVYRVRGGVVLPSSSGEFPALLGAEDSKPVA